jgi:hypothetical protein
MYMYVSVIEDDYNYEQELHYTQKMYVCMHVCKNVLYTTFRPRKRLTCSRTNLLIVRRERMCVSAMCARESVMCVCERERLCVCERECVYVCVFPSLPVYVVYVCICVCVCARIPASILLRHGQVSHLRVCVVV